MSLSPVNSVGSGLPLGLPGAVAATRYAGATASGAPATGTFEAGDFVVTQDGSLYICTAAGSPGTWAQVSGGGGGSTELAYVELTSTVSVTATSAATPNDVLSAGQLSFDGSTRACIEFFAPAVSTGSGAFLIMLLWDADTDLGRILQTQTANNPLNVAAYVRRFLTPSAGDHTYRIRAYRITANGSITGGAGGADTLLPAYIRVSTAPAAS